MKTTIFSLALLIILSTLAACTKSNDQLGSSAAQSAKAGTWRITLFSENGDDENASDFAGYEFTFDGTGALTAVKGGITKTGSWSTSSNRFNIDLGAKGNGNKPLGELTDDWKILSSSETEIKLTDDNATKNELLTFSKN